MLGPDCVLVRRTAWGYRCIAFEEAAALQHFLFGDAKKPDWLFEQCRRIAKARDNGEIVLAQILGLYIPIDNLGSDQLRRLAAAARLTKANFDPDEPRVPKGNPDGANGRPGAAMGLSPKPPAKEAASAVPENTCQSTSPRPGPSVGRDRRRDACLAGAAGCGPVGADTVPRHPVHPVRAQSARRREDRERVSADLSIRS
ncbi:MAG TPA: hypothetical protein VE993_17925 [Stellaceae bacterium]|nr:hypothetical protein [Stellaceae bacterium]